MAILLLLATLITLFSFAFGACAGLRSRLTLTQQWVVHTHRVTECIQHLAVQLAGVNDEGRTVTPQSIDDTLNRLTRLTSDNPRQQLRIAELRPLISRVVRLDEQQPPRVDWSEPAVENTGRQGVNAPRRHGSNVTFARLNTQIDVITKSMQDDEASLLQRRSAAADQAIQSTQLNITRALWLVIALLALSFAIVVVHLAERGRAENKLKNANDALQREQESLRSVTTFLSEVAKARFDVSEITKLVTGRTRELTGATGAVIEIADGDDLVYHTVTGDLAGSAGTRLSIGHSFSGLCLRTGKILRTDDVETDDRVDRETSRRLGVRSMVAVPLMLDGAYAGVLKVTAPKPAAFDDHAMEILELMGGVIATAMSRAGQFQAGEALLRDRTEAVASLEQAQSELKLQLRNVEDLNVVLQFQSDELQKANTQLEALATTDGLTGLKNHRAFQERLREECVRAERYGAPLSLVLIDVDHFKQFNDAFGHPAGDAVLQRVAGILEDVTRDCDLAARYGGEEFVFVLPQSDLDGGLVVAERCRARIESSPWHDRAITASFGLAVFRPGLDTPADLISRADQALYHAKSHGRNRVSCETPLPPRALAA